MSLQTLASDPSVVSAGGTSPRRPQTENVLKLSPRNNSRYIEALGERPQPSTMGVPPIYGQRDLGGVDGYHPDRDSADGVHLNQREQALDAKAEYWREKFRALERAVHSRSGVEDHAGPTITMLESKINFL